MRYLLFCLVWLAACTSTPSMPEPTQVVVMEDDVMGETAVSPTNADAPELSNLEEARSRLDYIPYMPTYTFPDEYMLQGIDVREAEQMAVIIYELQNDVGNGAKALLVIQQYPGDSFLEEWHESEIDHVETVTIDETIEGEYLIESLTFSEGGILQTLRWQQDGLSFVITEAGGYETPEHPMNQQVLIDIATSMRLAE